MTRIIKCTFKLPVIRDTRGSRAANRELIDARQSLESRLFENRILCTTHEFYSIQLDNTVSLALSRVPHHFSSMNSSGQRRIQFINPLFGPNQPANTLHNADRATSRTHSTGFSGRKHKDEIIIPILLELRMRWYKVQWIPRQHWTSEEENTVELFSAVTSIGQNKENRKPGMFSMVNSRCGYLFLYLIIPCIFFCNEDQSHCELSLYQLNSESCAF